MKTHPFKPILDSQTQGMLIGTLPPDTAPFYYSNSRNTRLWDLLYSVKNNLREITKGSNELSEKEKIDLLYSMNLGMCDMIYTYDRKKENSVQDSDIIPMSYLDVAKTIRNTNVSTLYFVYKNSAKWFLHALKSKSPVSCNSLHYDIKDGHFADVWLNDKPMRCILLPSPLSRGRKGETLAVKLEVYRKFLQLHI
ncbi:hypothetical protein [Aureibacter tunicatorum]|uniref:G:T/U-mismatch repair DNA glycosylase n=1 Tax=Aureibacter tunicatorum TaxID=866807 RepID=A0AAE4BUC8_9BACT|nr:hypothetical protein [Aureibacter tunicatorum]MDR6240597.1 G:T/U-mismatch repair DNA glycosylase [Aureibacter tunicatorum]BDD06542.1 hypothetical protein AUTU_40250 [Aureibacter tunicatorum]